MICLVVYSVLTGVGATWLGTSNNASGVGMVVAGSVGLFFTLALIISWTYLSMFHSPPYGGNEEHGCCHGWYGQKPIVWGLFVVLCAGIFIGLIIWGATSSGALRVGLLVGACMGLGHIVGSLLLLCCLAGISASHG
jgi:hypothetical protein